jgi:hypothetical protein
MRWTGHVARMGRVEVRTGFWWVNMRERDNLIDLGVDGSHIPPPEDGCSGGGM